MSLVREALAKLHPEWTASEVDEEAFALQEEESALIVMHRDIHFGGKFSIMLENDELFEHQDIERLAHLEEQLGQNIAPLLLSPEQMVQVGTSLKVYKQLRDLYELKESGHARTIADLILAEDWDARDKAIEAAVREGSALVPDLLLLLQSETFCDPLYPGFGLGPIAAAEVLGRIGDERAVVPLFELVGHSEGDLEEAAIEALCHMGELARPFLLQRLKSLPVRPETENAALVLADLPPDAATAAAAKELLNEEAVKRNSYLTELLEELSSAQ